MRKTTLLQDYGILLRKEFRLLVRNSDYLWALLFLTIILTTTTSASVALAWVAGDVKVKLFSPLLWLIFLLTCVITLEKGYESEVEAHAFSGVLLTGVSPSLMYLAKVTASFICISGALWVTTILLGMLLSVPLTQVLLPLFGITLPAVLGFTSLATLLQPMSAFSRLRGLLLPLLLLPLLFPLFFAASSLSTELILSGSFNWGSFSLTLLVILDVIYLAVGINVYEYALTG